LGVKITDSIQQQEQASKDPDLLGEFNVALLHSDSLFWELHLLEERDYLLLPENALVFFLQVDKWVACLAVMNVGQSCLHSQTQVITNNLPKVHNLYQSQF
jgi:hypothetical protein